MVLKKRNKNLTKKKIYLKLYNSHFKNILISFDFMEKKIMLHVIFIEEFTMENKKIPIIFYQKILSKTIPFDGF